MRVKDIKIFPCFGKNLPKPEKIEQKERYYLENGKFESGIILDGAGNLIDGYTTYLLAVKHGIDNVPISYGRRQVITGAHRPGGKLYVWELPGNLVDRVHIGDKVMVWTASGLRAVRVARVQKYDGQGHEPRRMVIKRYGKGGSAGGYQRVGRIDNP